jgi:hypothetical protein
MFRDWLKINSFWGFAALVLVVITITNLLVKGDTTVQLATGAENTFVNGIRALRI